MFNLRHVSLVAVLVAAPTNLGYAQSFHEPQVVHFVDEDHRSDLTTIVINVGFGYGIEIELEPDTKEDVVELIKREALKVINDPEVQKEAAVILATTFSVFSAVSYIAKTVAARVIDSAIVSIELVKLPDDYATT